MDFFQRNNESNEQGGGISIGNPLSATFENVAIPHKSLFPELSLYTRIKFFLGFLILSLLFSILGLALMLASLRLFAAFYSLGTCSALFSIFFLVGPMEQIKAIVTVQRLTASILLIGSIVLTLCAALWWHNGILAVLFCVCEFVSFIWYVLSYVPYARTLIKHIGGACCSV